MRPEECSGPWPSYPCGRLITNEDRQFHLASPLTMQLSIIICAPFAKSPNCASQMTRQLGLWMDYPYSKPSTAYSLKSVLTMVKVLTLEVVFTLWNRFSSSLVDWSHVMACRCEKVPLFTSCPDRRTRVPSVINVPNASASPMAQSKVSFSNQFLYLLV